MKLTVPQVSDYRGKDRGRVTASTFTRYQKGHDWGWADHPEEGVTRLGWWRRLGLKRVRFHDMRDTAATHLLSGTWGYEWSVKRVSSHLGHEDTKVTEARYAHVTKASQRSAAQRTTHGVRAVTQAPAVVDPEKKPAQHLPTPVFASSPKSLTSLALPAGFEPATNGLGSPESASDFKHLQAPGQVLGRFESKTCLQAQALLKAIAAGEPSDGRALASAVLTERAVALAFEVLAGGPFALERALELAKLIDSASEEAEKPAASTRSPGRPSLQN
jgi:hypothetical protein